MRRMTFQKEVFTQQNKVSALYVDERINIILQRLYIPPIGMLYTAVKSYKLNKFDEISVNIGAVVEVLQKSEHGWWLVR